MNLLNWSNEKNLIFLIVSFFTSFIFVNILYVFLITPSSLELINIAQANNEAPPRTFSVLLKDIEQQICLIIFFWVLIIASVNYLKINEEDELLESDLSDKIKLETLVATKLESETFNIESLIENKIDYQVIDMSLIKYMSWAVPSIGFIGTVRGIGMALEKSGEAIAGDISGMTESLGLAFNSTFVAVLLSIFIMLIINLIEQRQDQIIIKLRSKFLES